MSQTSTRVQIVEVADRLFYQRGYDSTSFSDISKAVKISRGNVTFHFKTKDEILEAVIDLRLERTRRMLEQWEADGKTCVDRIKSFINILIVNRTKILLYGCPVGTLCTELAKIEHGAQAHANEVFGLFRNWLRQQFIKLGREAEADELAMHLLAWSQGIATLAQAFRDEKFVREEVQKLQRWLDGYLGTARRKSRKSRGSPGNQDR